MSDIAIKVEALSKLYKIGKLQRRHDTLRDRIADNRLFNLFKRRNGSARNGHAPTHDSSLITHHSDLLWALKDVSFEVKRGEVVGIIGRNGAGKSTLLKILSRITEPTEGYADIYGRVGSLLEVGTGFHPELTGRENIYLNGSILGMKRTEIVQKFEEIVDFAEVEKFIDTPVKHYSSGMYLRLAFAVAAHLDPDILLVDEVLAVGDLAFQRKCLGKMDEVAKDGRTVIFVSHSMNAIRSLCKETIVLENGGIQDRGPTSATTIKYESKWLFSERAASVSRTPQLGKDLWISRIELRNGDGASTSTFRIGDTIQVLIHLAGNSGGQSFSYDIHLYSLGSGIAMYTGSDRSKVFFDRSKSPLACEIGPISLMPGLYSIRPSLRVPKLTPVDTWEDAITFEVVPSDVLGTGIQYDSGCGIVFIPHKWLQEFQRES